MLTKMFFGPRVSHDYTQADFLKSEQNRINRMFSIAFGLLLAGLLLFIVSVLMG